jgi:hypothetical protein
MDRRTMRLPASKAAGVAMLALGVIALGALAAVDIVADGAPPVDNLLARDLFERPPRARGDARCRERGIGPARRDRGQGLADS